MKKWHLTEQQKDSIIAAAVILVGVLVLLGQVVEAKSGSYSDILTILRTYIDPMQYMVGMLVINFILVLAAIKKHEKIPNPVLVVLKWNFSILLISDFIVLVLRVFQNSNLIALKGSLTMGMGKSYLLLATVRALIELTMTSAATLLLVNGLTRYAPVGKGSTGESKLRKTMIGLVIFQWIVSIPVNCSAFVTSRFVFAWSLGLSQVAQITVVALFYWIVKEFYQNYHTRFFRRLTQYYGLSLIVTGIVFTYSMGSFGVLQRFPAGESEMFGGFGQIVFYAARIAYIILNYLMYRAITDYAEAGMVNAGVYPNSSSL